MGLPAYEVDVPTRSTTQPGLEGVHVINCRFQLRSYTTHRTDPHRIGK
jgi:hypothetical protein